MIALAERGALFDPGPCMYMEKLAVGPAVDPNAVNLNKSIKENLDVVAKALNKPIGYVEAVYSLPFMSFLPPHALAPLHVCRKKDN